MNDFLPITKIPRTGLPERALVVGDPERVSAVAGLLTDPEAGTYLASHQYDLSRTPSNGKSNGVLSSARRRRYHVPR